METPTKPFSPGAFLKELRGQKTQDDFATLLGISRKTVIRLEADEASPTAELLLKLNVLYGVDPFHMLTGQRPDLALLTEREKRVLKHFRSATEGGKQMIEATASFASRAA